MPPGVLGDTRFDYSLMSTGESAGWVSVTCSLFLHFQNEVGDSMKEPIVPDMRGGVPLGRGRGPGVSGPKFYWSAQDFSIDKIKTGRRELGTLLGLAEKGKKTKTNPKNDNRAERTRESRGQTRERLGPPRTASRLGGERTGIGDREGGVEKGKGGGSEGGGRGGGGVGGGRRGRGVG